MACSACNQEDFFCPRCHISITCDIVLGVGGRTLVPEKKGLFSLPLRSDWPWGPTGVLSVWAGCSLSVDKAAGHECQVSQLNIRPTFRLPGRVITMTPVTKIIALIKITIICWIFFCFSWLFKIFFLPPLGLCCPGRPHHSPPPSYAPGHTC